MHYAHVLSQSVLLHLELQFTITICKSVLIASHYITVIILQIERRKQYLTHILIEKPICFQS